MTTTGRLFLTVMVFCLVLSCKSSSAQYRDYSGAKIYLVKKGTALDVAAGVFQSVVEEHTGISLPISGGKKAGGEELSIIICTDDQMGLLPEGDSSVIRKLPVAGAEGFRIAALPGGGGILIAGRDDRGALFGVGYLLRKMELRRQQVLVPEDIHISSTPAYAIRGHQLGYRPKTNAYDAWTVDQFDRYIRDLAIFGNNSIEIMPPRTDDAFENSHMVMPAIKMIAEQSRIAKKYGMDVWMWYPNMGSEKDYTTPSGIRRELDERAEVFKVLPRLDNLFVPGGDPGNLQPDELFDWLEKVSVVLHKYHPNAKIWVSPQVFRPTEDWYQAFYKRVNAGYPWFGGVVYGPWIKETIQEVRERVRKDIPIRRYPDITHSLSCQYPVPEWDLAFAETLGRECYNPRPYDEKHIHNLYAKYAKGSISYSEGINDDVNKFVWSDQNWDPNTPVMETLRDYARLFIDPDDVDGIAQGIVGLENNFRGSLLTNDGVERTLQQWQEMEKRATPEVMANYRFQMNLLRAYYDAYTKRRLLYETNLQQLAMDALREWKEKGIPKVVQEARMILEKSNSEPVRPDLRARCFALMDSVYRSIQSQLTTRAPQLAQRGRGDFMDGIDVPLNDSEWILARLDEVEKTGDEKLKETIINSILYKNYPGMGGVYKDLGSLNATWDHVVRQKTWAEDPGGLRSPFVSFEGKKAFDNAEKTHLTTLYNTPLMLSFDGLDTAASYVIGVSYTGRFGSKIKLMANDRFTIHDYMGDSAKSTYKFRIPHAATRTGHLNLTWSCQPGNRGTEVSEIWLSIDNDQHNHFLNDISE